jgi:hypothetical protein
MSFRITICMLIVLAGSAFLATNTPAQRLQTKSCTITVAANPASPSTVSENGVTAIVVTAHYEGGPPTNVHLSAHNLPPFASGWSNVSRYCADCIIADTVYLAPDFCSAGDYNFEFIGVADLDAEYGDDLVEEYNYLLSVEDADRPCLLQSVDTVTTEAGKHIQFNIKFFDDDRECAPNPELQWRFFGYPFDHGAVVFDSGRFVRTFSWTPSERDIGRREATFRTNFGPSQCSHTVVINVLPIGEDCDDVAPVIIPEPEFTQGTSNTIYYRPQCGAYEHEVCYFDFEKPDQYLGCRITPNKNLAEANGIIEHHIDGLLDGHHYGYFVTAYFLQYPDSVSLSDTTSSIQDASPPHPVMTTTTEADSGGVVFVRWYGVVDDVSGVDYYEVYRRYSGTDYTLQARIPAAPNNGPSTPYVFVQSLDDNSGLVEGREYFYRVNAVDLVGNRGDGVETPAVVPDSTPPCLPDVSVNYDYHFFFHSYIGSTQCQAWGKSNCPGLEAAHFIRFEAARDSLKYFDQDWQIGYKLFKSETLLYQHDSTGYVFEFLPPTGGDAYVHGHTYYIRAQAMDSVGNVTAWSRPDSVIVDLRPPDDISNLQAAADLDFTDSTAIIRLTWDPAVDGLSGLDKYLIYRKIGDGAYELIDSVKTNAYVDHQPDFDSRVLVCYQVGSRDHVGNTRDITQTSWTACARPNFGPIISVDCRHFFTDSCLVGGDSARIFWDGYITDGVDYYIARCNGVETRQNDGSATDIWVPVTVDGEYSVKVKAVFDGGSVSTWSNIVTFKRDGTPPEPIDSLWVETPEPRPTYAALRWNQPYDASGVFFCMVLRKSQDGWDTLGTGPGSRWMLWRPPETCTTYQEYTYTVYPIDLPGNVQDSGNPEISVVCRKSPTIDTVTVDGGIIRVDWSRATPNLAAKWFDSVYVSQTYLSGDELLTRDSIFTILQDSGCSFDANTWGAGYYEFQVSEVPTDLPDSVYSIWSRAKGVAFDYQPDTVTELIAQPQPMLPNDADTPNGLITLWWKYDSPISVHCFEVIRYRNGNLDWVTCSRPRPFKDGFKYVDGGLFADSTYRYCIVVVDRYQVESDSVCIETAINPLAMYTPRVASFDKPFFNTDTMTVSWEWVNSDSDVAATDYGAVCCSLQVSIDSSFQDYIWSTQCVPADDRQAPMKLDVSQLGGIRTLYFRAKAQDWFGNWSPWSTEYYGVVTRTYDIIPPAAVSGADRFITATADSSAAPGLIDVHLNWLKTTDVPAGVEYYTIYRDRNDGNWQWIGQVDSQTTRFTQDTVRVIDPGSCEYRYTVRATDRAGNEQKANNVLGCLIPLPAPSGLVADSVRGTHWNPYPEEADSLYVECSCNRNDLGTIWILEQDKESWMYLLPDATSAHFNTGGAFEACAHVYFHIKAILSGMESPWSEVAVFPDNGQAPANEGIPEKYALLQNYPNPFNPVTQISLSLPASGHVSLKIYNIVGETIRTLVNGDMSAGSHALLWDGTDDHGHAVASGIYIYRVKTTGFSDSKKMLLLR